MNVHESTVFLIFSQKKLNDNCLIAHVNLFHKRLVLKYYFFMCDINMKV